MRRQSIQNTLTEVGRKFRVPFRAVVMFTLLVTGCGSAEDLASDDDAPPTGPVVDDSLNPFTGVPDFSYPSDMVAVLGQGFDTRTGQPTPMICTCGDVASGAQSAGDKTFTAVRSGFELGVQFSYSLAARVGSVLKFGELSRKLEAEFRTDRDRANVTGAARYGYLSSLIPGTCGASSGPSSLRLTDDALALLQDQGAEAFRRACGDSFILSIPYESSMVANVELASSSWSLQAEFSQEASVGLRGLEASSGLSAGLQTALREGAVSANFSFVGAPAQTDGPCDFAEEGIYDCVMSRLDGHISQHRESDTDMYARGLYVSAYNTLANWPARLDSPIPKRMDPGADVAEAYFEYDAIYKTIEWMRNPNYRMEGDFCVGTPLAEGRTASGCFAWNRYVTEAELEEEQKKLTAAMDEMRLRAEDCRDPAVDVCPGADPLPLDPYAVRTRLPVAFDPNLKTYQVPTAAIMKEHMTAQWIESVSDRHCQVSPKSRFCLTRSEIEALTASMQVPERMPTPGPIPAGSYKSSCRDCGTKWVGSDPVLDCRCRDRDQEHRRTTLKLTRPGVRIDNVNGRLRYK